MCGIVGRFNFLSGTPVETILLRAMSDVLTHRGPDSEGTYVNGAVGLGHRRLAIIDLSPAGRQPMTGEDDRIWITYNGEIYNFLELRADLERLGHSFRSNSDTEVILASYREFGVRCLDRLRGMYALAIWDGRDRSLLLARDRLGKKPLHYMLDPQGIAFASEPKAFLADPTFKPEPNLLAISHYLTCQYVPSPISAFAGVRKLPPAHYLLVKDGKVSVERYWKLRYGQKRHMSEDAACEELLARLREAVRLRLISDVPLGAFLSGGIDSSMIVALMAEASHAPVKTFSIGFEEQEFDELPQARLVAQRYATDHHEFVVRPEAAEIFSKLVWHYNEPYADASAIPMYYLAQMTRRHVTVALNGDGGDENFAGYERYFMNLVGTYYDRIPWAIRRPWEKMLGFLPASPAPRSLVARGKRFFDVLAEPRERRYARYLCPLSPSTRAELCTEDFRRAVGSHDELAPLVEAYRTSDARDWIDATLDVDVSTYLPDDLLVKVDIASMAHGLESRSPLLDHEFMEFCASLPSDLKLRGSVRKYIFKRAARGLVPPEIIHRPKKGFGVPIKHWFRWDLREFLRDLLLSPRAVQRGYFRTNTIERMLDEHDRGTQSWHYELWILVMLELWHRMFIDVEGREVGATAAGGAVADRTNHLDTLVRRAT